jgi:hypothetical protein
MRNKIKNKPYFINARISEKHNSIILELVNGLGMTRTGAVEYVLEFFDHYVRRETE